MATCVPRVAFKGPEGSSVRRRGDTTTERYGVRNGKGSIFGKAKETKYAAKRSYGVRPHARSTTSHYRKSNPGAYVERIIPNCRGRTGPHTNFERGGVVARKQIGVELENSTKVVLPRNQVSQRSGLLSQFCANRAETK